MTLQEYQNTAKHTAVYTQIMNITYPLMGLRNKAGEAIGKVENIIKYCNGNFTQTAKNDIAEELGDALWYIANAAYDIGFTLDDIAEMNINKLEERKKFSNNI